MFDNKQTNQNPPNNQAQDSSIDEDLQNTGPSVNLQNINKDKEFPFKKVDQAPSSLQELATEDIFSKTDEGEINTVAKPLDFNNQQQAPVVNTPPSLGMQDQQKDNTTVEDLSPEVNLMQKTGKKSNVLMTVIIVVLAVVLLSLAGFWVYSKYANNEEETFEEFGLETEEQNFNDMLKDFSNTLDEQPAPEPVPEEPVDIIEKPVPSTRDDSDGDGLIDNEEISLGTNPKRFDSDFDGLSDYDEVKTYFTDPADVDSDKDGYLDGVEVDKGYNPLGPGKLNPDEEEKNIELKEYLDNENNFQISYPSNWYYKKFTDGDVIISFDQASSLSELDSDISKHKFSISLVENNNKNVDASEWLEVYYAGIEFTDKKYINIDTYYDAVQTAQAPTIGDDVLETHLIRDNLVYIFRLVDGNANDKESYNQIILSFKFLK
ncbi:MAG: hypothetical protein ABIA91_01015 [Patescibacteria group bacterium]